VGFLITATLPVKKQDVIHTFGTA